MPAADTPRPSPPSESPTPAPGVRLSAGQVEVYFCLPLLGTVHADDPPALPHGPTPPVPHAPGFEAVRWGDVLYTFTPAQRLVVAALFDARTRGYEYVSQETLLEVAESDGLRLRDLFRGHPAWGTMILSGLTAGGPAGTYRLADPGA